MKLFKEKKISNIFYISILFFLILITVILVTFHLLWWYFIIGFTLGIVTHFLMIVQNNDFYRIVNNKYEKAVYSPKKSAAIWYGLRILVSILFLTGAILLCYFTTKERMLEATLLILGGYMLVKIVFIVVLILFERKKV